jgi:hypothetical protein
MNCAEFYLGQQKNQALCETMMNLNRIQSDQNSEAETSDQRQYPRVPLCNLISYATIDRQGDPSDHRMGRALDVSQNGVYLETASAVTSKYISLMTSDVVDKLIEIKGKVAYSRENGDAMFRTGIRFEGTHDENVRFAKKLIRVYHNRTTGYHISTDRSARF